MKQKNWSKDTNSILQKRKGYRCETQRVTTQYTGPQPLFETLYSEVIELGNTHVTRDICKSLGIKEIDACKLIDRDTEHGINPMILEELVYEVKKKTQISNPKALWLATYENAKHYYCQPDEKPVQYQLSSDAIVLSDLGPDGTLFLDRMW